MKLTTDQINQIDETLVFNKVVYDDIKLELTDHIASDIEEIMVDENVSFEEAFKDAFQKWKGMLKDDTFSFFPLVFFWKSGPKIVVDKWYKETRRQLLYSVLFSICGTALTILIMNSVINSFENIIEEVYKMSLIAMFFVLLIGRILIFTTKVKTTLGSMFNAYFVIYLFLGLQISGLLHDFRFAFSSTFYSPPYALFLIAHSSFSIRLLYKHFQFEKKLSNA